MKHKKLFIIMIPIVLIALMALVPVQTSKAACGFGERFSIILGQYEKFKQASISPTEIVGCPQYIHDSVPNRLYIL
jgi:hypothetical protein